MKLRTLVFAGLAVAAFAVEANAQTFAIPKSVIGAGGGPMTGGGISMNGTIGQTLIGPISGGNFIINQGFWYTVPASSDVKRQGEATGFALAQNYPNPFNPSTTIEFSIPERTKVTLRVMNLLGEEVQRVIDGEYYDPGTYRADFIAEDLPSGTYVYRLEAGNHVMSKKMVLMK